MCQTSIHSAPLISAVCQLKNSLYSHFVQFSTRLLKRESCDLQPASINALLGTLSPFKNVTPKKKRRKKEE